MISASIISDRLKVNMSVARRAMAELVRRPVPPFLLSPTFHPHHLFFFVAALALLLNVAQAKKGLIKPVALHQTQVSFAPSCLLVSSRLMLPCSCRKLALSVVAIPPSNLSVSVACGAHVLIVHLTISPSLASFCVLQFLPRY
jgi:hypothetical protein